MTPDDLSRLERDFPAVRFGTVWTSGAGPRRRRYWARRTADNALFTAPSAAALRTRIEAGSGLPHGAGNSIWGTIS